MKLLIKFLILTLISFNSFSMSDEFIDGIDCKKIKHELRAFKKKGLFIRPFKAGELKYENKCYTIIDKKMVIEECPTNDEYKSLCLGYKERVKSIMQKKRDLKKCKSLSKKIMHTDLNIKDLNILNRCKLNLKS